MTDRARVFPEAQTVLRMLLQDLDQRAPGLFPDVYIVGSLALDDVRPGKSDIDLVLVRSESGTNDEAMAALIPAIEMIRTMYPDPALDGIVLGHGDLAVGPAMIEGPRPVIFEGHVDLEKEGSARNPVTWQVLRQGGIAWRGRPLREIDLHHDPNLLRSWTRGNLESYWRPWLAKSGRLLSPFGTWSLRPDFTEWGVLGVTRLHYTLATGEIVSKTGAGQYALTTFPEYWHKIVREAMDIRSNPDRTRSFYRRDVLGRRKEARDYIAMVIEDALGM
jgi:hypothetical protein